MGFLKSLLKGFAEEAGRAVADKLEETIGDAIGGGSEHTGSTSYTSKTSAPARRSSAGFGGSENTFDGATGKNMAYFRTVLQEEFPTCTLEENVSAERLGWCVEKKYRDRSRNYPSRPYEFAMYRDNRLVMVILLTDHNRETLAICKNTVETARAYGVPCLNFLMHLPNERGYIKERIEKALA